jgi:ferredoxin
VTASESDKTWTVVIDRDRCMGSGLCITYAPGTFEHDEEARAVLRTPTTDNLDEVRTAVEACPTGAIQLIAHEGESIQ